MNNILIIKTGHCETFCEFEDHGICSLGDVLRTTFILDFYKNDNVTWVTDKKAFELFIDIDVNVVPWEDFKSLDLGKYETIINLEKKEELLHRDISGINSNNIELLKKLSLDEKMSYQEKLCNFLGKNWDYQRYKFRSSKLVGDGVGLNWQVGSKFPEKAMNREFWENLSKCLETKYKVSWQRGFNDLSEYINWIDSVETLVTLDSLGAHIGLALNKKVICLFGPTNLYELEMYGIGKKIDINSLTENQIIDKIFIAVRD